MARERSRRQDRTRSAVSAAFTAAALTISVLLTAGTAGASEKPAAAGPVVGASAVPAHAVTGYWQNFDNGATTQKLSDVPGAYDIIAVAFADATGTPGQVDFTLDPATGYGSEEEFKADIQAKHADGKSVIVSVGGEKGQRQRRGRRLGDRLRGQRRRPSWTSTASTASTSTWRTASTRRT